MTIRRKWPYALGGLGVAAAAALFAPGIGIIAADHLDPPARTDPSVDSTPDRPADIADVYAWHTDDKMILALTFAGPQATDKPATYDPDVLYTINVSNKAPRTTADFPIYVRFAKGAGANQYGVQVSGIPGVTGTIEGSVEKTLTRTLAEATDDDDAKIVTVRAGLFDDPFFFDLQGFKDTAATGTLSFNPNRDFFAGQNLTAVVIEIPLENVDAGSLVDVWGTTARFGGQL